MRKPLFELLAFVLLVLVVMGLVQTLRSDAACAARGGVMIPGRVLDHCVRMEPVR